MKKSARKILALVLTLVLICTLATAAFAATYVDIEEDYGTNVVCAYASIAKYTINGQIYVNDGEDTGDLRSVNIQYKYYIKDSAGNLLVRPESGFATLTDSITSGHVASVSKTYTSSQIYCMSYGLANFRANVYAWNATQPFTALNQRIEYFVP